MFREVEVPSTTENRNDRSLSHSDEIAAETNWHTGADAGEAFEAANVSSARGSFESPDTRPGMHVDRDSVGFTSGNKTLRISNAMAVRVTPPHVSGPGIEHAVDFGGHRGYTQARDMFDTKLSLAIRAGQGLGELLEPYKQAVRAYFVKRGVASQDADDCFQDFVLKFLRKPETVGQFDPRRGRFRDWLGACARNHAFDWLRRNTDKPVPLSNPDELPAPDSDSIPKDDWKRALLSRAIENVRRECARKGRSQDFQIFVTYHFDNTRPRKTWADIADEFGLANWKVAYNKSAWVTGRLAKEICRLIGEYVTTKSQIQDELRDLLS